MTGYRPLILVWLALAVTLIAFLEDATGRAVDRFDQWLADRRADRALDREAAQRLAMARALHPSSKARTSQWN